MANIFSTDCEPSRSAISGPIEESEFWIDWLVPSRSYDIMIAVSTQSCRPKGLLKILCQSTEAQMLLVLANALYPDAASAIAEAIDFANFPDRRRA